MEGLGDAIYLCNLTKEIKRTQKYSEHAKMGYRWLLELQFNESNMDGVDDPQKALGGFRKSLYDPQLRIDNTQHAISSFAKGLRYVFGQEPVIGMYVH
jgi:hypothetical protein